MKITHVLMVMDSHSHSDTHSISGISVLLHYVGAEGNDEGGKFPLK